MFQFQEGISRETTQSNTYMLTASVLMDTLAFTHNEILKYDLVNLVITDPQSSIAWGRLRWR